MDVDRIGPRDVTVPVTIRVRGDPGTARHALGRRGTYFEAAARTASHGTDSPLR